MNEMDLFSRSSHAESRGITMARIYDMSSKLAIYAAHSEKEYRYVSQPSAGQLACQEISSPAFEKQKRAAEIIQKCMYTMPATD